MDDSVNELIFSFLVWPLPETAMGLLCNCAMCALQYQHTLRDKIIPLVRSLGSPRTKMI